LSRADVAHALRLAAGLMRLHPELSIPTALDRAADRLDGPTLTPLAADGALLRVVVDHLVEGRLSPALSLLHDGGYVFVPAHVDPTMAAQIADRLLREGDVFGPHLPADAWRPLVQLARERADVVEGLAIIRKRQDAEREAAEQARAAAHIAQRDAGLSRRVGRGDAA